MISINHTIIFCFIIHLFGNAYAVQQESSIPDSPLRSVPTLRSSSARLLMKQDIGSPQSTPKIQTILSNSNLLSTPSSPIVSIQSLTSNDNDNKKRKLHDHLDDLKDHLDKKVMTESQHQMNQNNQENNHKHENSFDDNPPRVYNPMQLMQPMQPNLFHTIQSKEPRLGLYIPTEFSNRLLHRWDENDECIYTTCLEFKLHATIPFHFYQNRYTPRHFFNHLAIIQLAIQQHPMTCGSRMYSEFIAFANYLRLIPLRHTSEYDQEHILPIDKECLEFFDAQLRATIIKPMSVPNDLNGIFNYYNQYRFPTLQALYTYHYEQWQHPLPILNLIVRGYLILTWNYMKNLPVFANYLENMEALFTDMYNYFTDPALFWKCGTYNTYNHYTLLIDTTFSSKP